MNQNNNKKKFGCMRLFLGFFLCLFALVLLWGIANFGGSGPRAGEPVMEVSPSTTGIIEPLDQNGDVDYFEAVNRALSQNVTPDNNAAVLLVQAVGPGLGEPPELLPDELFERLQINRPPEDGDYFRGMNRFEHDEDYDFAAFSEQYDFALENMWLDEDLPEVARWLKLENPALDKVVLATRRKDFYLPVVSEQTDRPKMIMNADMRMVQVFRDMTRGLVIRANQSLERNELENWNRDVIAAYRLSEMVSRGSSMVELLVGIAINNIANGNVVSSAQSGRLDRDELLKLREQLESLPRITDISHQLKYGEKFMGLDTLAVMGRHGPGVLNLRGGDDVPNLLWKAVDLNEAGKILVKYYVELAEICQISDITKRREALTSFETELEAYQRDIKMKLIPAMLLGRKSKGKWFGELLSNLMMPALIHVQDAHSRYQSENDMVRILLSLEAFKLDHEKYPEQLGDLVPDYIPEIPVDSFTETPFSYSLDEDDVDFKLYSFGSDGIDDGGDNLMKDWPLRRQIKMK